MAVNVKKITADGPGHALLELGGDPGTDRLEIAVRDVYRDEYLGPSTPDKTTWLKRPHYFEASRVEGAGGIAFRIGPEICNYVPAETMVEISSRDGVITAASQIAWEGITLLDLKPPPSDPDDDKRRRLSPEPKPKPDERTKQATPPFEGSGAMLAASATNAMIANYAMKVSDDTGGREKVVHSTDETASVRPGSTQNVVPQLQADPPPILRR